MRKSLPRVRSPDYMSRSHELPPLAPFSRASQKAGLFDTVSKAFLTKSLPMSITAPEVTSTASAAL